MKQILPLALAALTIWSMAGYAQQTTAITTADGQAAPPPATVTGSGTTNFIPLWTGSTTLGNSKLFQTGAMVGVGTTSPTVALDVNGRVNVSRSYRLGGMDVLVLPHFVDNTAIGIQAMQSVTTAGRNNTAVGYFALNANTSGGDNTAMGQGALQSNTTSFENTGIGYAALFSSEAGENTAVGSFALTNSTTGLENTGVGFDAISSNSSGSHNTAFGGEALTHNTTGSSNIAIGYLAASNVSGSNSDNVEIGNVGVLGDSGIIRVGTSGSQSSFFAAGIRSVITGLNDAVPVVIDSNGQLGTVVSSRRFKEDIQDMGDASRGLMQLRPVTFRYQKAFEDGSKPVQYGLIAEEVAQVYPDLVAHSADGTVETVKYQVLDSMLLNEVQRQQAEIRSLEERLARMEAALTSAVQGNGVAAGNGVKPAGRELPAR